MAISWKMELVDSGCDMVDKKDKNSEDKNLHSVVRENLEHPKEYPNAERFEIIAGIRYELTPAPTIRHQKLITQIWYHLHLSCHPQGTFLVAPVDVHLDENNIFQPDVIFVSNENEAIIKETHIEGAPDLIVEILSPSTSVNDKSRKKTQYERHGVKEYWIADPIHSTIDQFILEKRVFHLHSTFVIGDTVISPLFPCISIHMGELFGPLEKRKS